MSKDTFILHEWEKEKMDELTKLAYEEDGHKKGLEQGFDDAISTVAKNMLKDNLSLDLISKYTNLSHEELEKIKEEL